MIAAILLSAALTVPQTLPGAEPFPDDLRARLETALAAQGSGKPPRTRHRTPEGAPRFTNRLLLEASPYLQQHAHNPVNWYPWSDEAFEAARRLDRPVLVSIGYSTCHWCHVMEDESYDDPEVAAYLNAHFVAIKVDREERPDVDSVYMNALHALRGSGGWPLNIWATPRREPFHGGTYFPRDEFMKTLRSVHGAWGDGRERLQQGATTLSAYLRKTLAGTRAKASAPVEPAMLRAALRHYTDVYDPEWGGQLGPRKFPASFPVRFLLRYHRHTGDPAPLGGAVFTLEKIAAGGIHDQIGGGFHRYTVDREWHVPHFEKMLYDNALLALAYLEAWQVTRRRDFAEVARETLDYLAREMTAPGGGFYSATDADSPTPAGEMEEGAFFTWTRKQMRAVLGTGGDAVADYFGVGDEPSVPWVVGSVAPAGVAEARSALYAERAKRPPPLRDEKILAAWNGLAISAFARAGFAFDRPDYLERAERAAAFTLSRRHSNGRLRRVQAGDGPAFLEDYAFVIAGLLDLHESARNPRWLREALSLQKLLDAHYADATGGGYFRTADDQSALLVREKPMNDGAIPSGNSVAAMNLLRLSALTGDATWRDRASLLFSAFHEELLERPQLLSEMLLAVDFALEPTREVVIVSGEGLDSLVDPLRRAHLPNRVVAIVDPEEIPALQELVPLVASKVAREGRATAYVCRDRVCAAPTQDPSLFASQLAEVEPLP